MWADVLSLRKDSEEGSRGKVGWEREVEQQSRRGGERSAVVHVDCGTGAHGSVSEEEGLEKRLEAHLDSARSKARSEYWKLQLSVSDSESCSTRKRWKRRRWRG